MSDLLETSPIPTAVRLFGTELRRYRDAAGLSQDEVGRHCNYTGAFIGMVENGKRTPPRDLAAQTDELLGTHGALLTLWNLVDQEPHPHWFRPFVTFEAEASSISIFEPQVITGLLQTEAYAFAVIRARNPEAASEDVQHDAKIRIQRQGTLQRQPSPRLWVVLDEAALRRVVGGTTVMREQLAAVLAAAEMPRVTIQVLPFSAGEHASLNGSLTLLGKYPEVAYGEGHRTARLITGPEEFAERRHTFSLLQASALPIPASLDLIRAAMAGYEA